MNRINLCVCEQLHQNVYDTANQNDSCQSKMIFYCEWFDQMSYKFAWKGEEKSSCTQIVLFGEIGIMVKMMCGEEAQCFLKTNLVWLNFFLNSEIGISTSLVAPFRYFRLSLFIIVACVNSSRSIFILNLTTAYQSNTIQYNTTHHDSINSKCRSIRSERHNYCAKEIHKINVLFHRNR